MVFEKVIKMTEDSFKNHANFHFTVFMDRTGPSRGPHVANGFETPV